MKKTIKVMLSLLLVFSLVACSSNKKSDPEPTASSSETQTEQNALIVYYSATGNTENVANQIADITGADLFELEPVQLYTDEDLDWTDDNSRVVYEYENENQRNVELVSTEVENWDSYDTVFIGSRHGGMICHRHCIVSLILMIFLVKQLYLSMYITVVNSQVR